MIFIHKNHVQNKFNSLSLNSQFKVTYTKSNCLPYRDRSTKGEERRRREMKYLYDEFKSKGGIGEGFEERWGMEVAAATGFAVSASRTE